MCQCGCCRAAASLVCVHPQLPEDVCRLLGIPPLQEVVSETVDVKQPLECVDTLNVSLRSQDNRKVKLQILCHQHQPQHSDALS